MNYKMTFWRVNEDYPIEECNAKTLMGAKREATRRYRNMWLDGKIIIYQVEDGGIREVSERMMNWRTWGDVDHMPLE